MLVVALVLLLEGCKSEVLFRQPRDASPSSPFCGASCADCDVVQKAGVSCVVFFCSTAKNLAGQRWVYSSFFPHSLS